MDRKKLALFGCGLEGEKIYYQMMRLGTPIERVYDNYKTGKFYGFIIRRISDDYVNFKEYFILVSSPAFYDEIKKQLEGYGLREFEDFIIGMSYNKKLAVVNANCYREVICRYLNSSRQFQEKYYIYYTKPVFEAGQEGLREDVLCQCDLFIHQDIREDNLYGYRVSDKYARTLLKGDCVDVTIPNMVGMGQAFFIQNCNSKYVKNIHEGINLPFGMFPYGDSIIDKMLENGRSSKEILDYFKSGTAFDKEEIIENFTNVIAKFREREKNWDIKIIDYIMENYKTRKVFYDAKHPTNLVMYQIAIKLLDYIGIEGDDISCPINLGGYETPIYPEVKEVLGLNYGGTDEILRTDSFCKLTDYMDIDEYVRQYIFWNTGV